MNAEQSVGGKVQDLFAQDESSNDDDDGKEYEDEEFDECVDGYVTDEKQIESGIINALGSSDRNIRREAATKLHRLVQRWENAAVQPIIDSGLLPVIITMLSSSDDYEVQVRTASILLFVVGGTSEQTTAAVEAGALPKLIYIASSSRKTALRNIALLSLGNIGTNSQALRERLIREGGLTPPLNILVNPSKYPHSTVCWAAKAINSYTDPGGGSLPRYETREQIFSALVGFILYEKDETAESLEASLLGLWNVFADETQIDKALKTDIVPRLAHLYTSEDPYTRRAAIQCVRRIIYSSVDGTEALIRAGIIDRLKTCIASEDVQDRDDAGLAAGNLIGGAFEHAKALIASGFIPLLVEVVLKPEEAPVPRHNAVWALWNAAHSWGTGHPEILDTLLEANVIEAFCSALCLKNPDSIELALKGILVLLQARWDGQKRAVERVKVAGGIAQLRATRYRDDILATELPKIAQQILNNYFSKFRKPPRI